MKKQAEDLDAKTELTLESDGRRIRRRQGKYTSGESIDSIGGTADDACVAGNATITHPSNLEPSVSRPLSVGGDRERAL